jgi:cytidylate kinase
MVKTQIHEDPRIVAAAERNMQAWVHTQETADRTIHDAMQRRLAECRLTYVTISREAGVGAGEIARLLGQKLGWEVLDKSLLDRVAERFHESRTMLDLVDETPNNWVYDVLGTWMDDQLVTHDKYVVHLTRVIRAAARNGKVVLVGRGAQFILPPEKGLTVRMIASEKYRIDQIMRRESLSEAGARQLMTATDRGRREFVTRYFHHDLLDPHLYDLVLNVGRLGPAGAIEQIIMALCR